MGKKYTFIHPTKSGGTALERYFEKHYSDYIVGRWHNNICTDHNNPIIVVRDVKSRFHSMFKYWKNGATQGEYQRDIGWLTKYKKITIYDFIEMIKNNKQELYTIFTKPVHFANTTHWIDPNMSYKNIIIIKYEEDLNMKIQKLINTLGIENKNIPVPKINVSKNNDTEYDDDDKVINDFINQYFKSDIELINKINNNPELFKLVI